MNMAQIDRFEKLQSLINSLYEEIRALSSKHPDDAINLFKLKLVNEALLKTNNFLRPNYLPFDDFKLFDEINLPTNSDVVMILASYLGSFEKLRSDNITESLGEWYWVIDRDVSSVSTKPPKSLQKK